MYALQIEQTSEVVGLIWHGLFIIILTAELHETCMERAMIERIRLLESTGYHDPQWRSDRLTEDIIRCIHFTIPVFGKTEYSQCNQAGYFAFHNMLTHGTETICS